MQRIATKQRLTEFLFCRCPMLRFFNFWLCISACLPCCPMLHAYQTEHSDCPAFTNPCMITGLNQMYCIVIFFFFLHFSIQYFFIEILKMGTSVTPQTVLLCGKVQKML